MEVVLGIRRYNLVRRQHRSADWCHHFRPVAVPFSFFQAGATRIRSDTRMIAVDNLNLFEHIPAALRN